MTRLLAIAFLWLFMSSFIHAQSTKKRIKNTLNYLQKTTENNSYNLHLMLHWLALKYDLNKSCLSPLPSKPIFEDDCPAFNFYNSLMAKANVQTNDSLKNYFDKSTGIERLLAWGTNASFLPFDSICRQTVQSYSLPNSNVRQVAHIAIAFYWANNNMDTATLDFFNHHKTTLETALLNGIAQETHITDNWMEGVIGLICIGRATLIKRPWIKALKKEQNKDGGWAWEPNENTSSHPHPTTLALWILLEKCS